MARKHEVELPKRVPTGRETRKLRRKLSDVERGQLASKMGLLVEQIVAMEIEHAGMRADMKDREKSAKSVLRDTAKDARDGTAVAEVECRWVVDFGRKVVQLIRLDTGAVVQDRPLVDDDRQLAIESHMQDAAEDLPEIELLTREDPPADEDLGPGPDDEDDDNTDDGRE